MAILRGPIEGANCTACPLAVDGRAVAPVPGIGPENPDWIVIGEGPGTVELQWKQPLVGPTGQLLNRALKETGVDRNRLWLGNATLCMPPRGTPEDMRAVAAKCCRPRLNKELAQFPKKPVLLLGGVATRELVTTRLIKMTDLAGTYHEEDVDGTGVRPLLPTIHPAALLHAQGKGGGDGRMAMSFISLKFDISKAKAIAAGRNIKLELNVSYEVEDSARASAAVQEIAKEILAEGFMYLDLETYVDDELRNSALQAFIAKIDLLGLSTSKRAIAVKWGLLDAKAINTFRALLANPKVTKVGHNSLTYDEAVLQNQWYRFVINGPREDTMLAHHAAFPGMAHRLQAVACQFRGIRPWKSEYRDSEDTPEQGAEYCATDTFTTAKTLPAVHFWIKKNQTERVYEVDRKKAMIAAQMHLKGEHIDPDVNEEIGRRLKIAIDASRGQILDTYESMKDKVLDRLAFEKAKTTRKKDPVGSQHFVDRMAIRLAEIKKDLERVDKKTGAPSPKLVFSPSNDWHMIALLKAQGVPLTKTTDKGRVSTAAGILEDLAHVPEVAALLRYRSNEKLNGFNRRLWNWHKKSDGTWAAPYVQDDGRMHSIWSPAKLSGRHGSEEPNAQNWSQGDEQNKDPSRRLPNLLRQRTAPPGRRIVGFDLEQLEARTMALQSDDPFLVKVFTEKRDIHGEFALLLFADFNSLIVKSAEYTAKRNITKRLEYGGLYGGADETVWKSIVVDFPEVTLPMTSTAIRTMKRVVVGVIRWQQRLFHQCSHPPYELQSYILGRKRVFPLGDPSPTDINNNPNQFTGADIMDIGLMNMLPKLEKYKGTVFMFANIHDAGYFECPDDDRVVAQVGRDIRDSWTQVHLTPSGKEIEFPIELKHGYAMHDHIPGQEWDGCGRPGLQKLKL